MNEQDLRDELAKRVKASRRKLFRTVTAAVKAADVSRGTWEKVEAGVRVKDFSLAAIEDALGWEPGYTDELLAGRDPDATNPLSAEERADLMSQIGEVIGGDADALRELARRLIAAADEVEGGDGNADESTGSSPSTKMPAPGPADQPGDVEATGGDALDAQTERRKRARQRSTQDDAVDRELKR